METRKGLIIFCSEKQRTELMLQTFLKMEEAQVSVSNTCRHEPRKKSGHPARSHGSYSLLHMK